MGNGCMKPNENIYFRCRKEAALYDARLFSRESAAELLGVSVSSLADYELGNTKVVPVDKVNLMADLYNAPQLKTSYCKYDCPLGDCMTVATEIFGLDTIVLRLINNLEEGKLTEVKKQLISIAASGGISTENVHSIDDILAYLDKMVESVSELKLVDANSVGIFFMNDDGRKSELQIRAASLVEYDGTTLTIYKPAVRGLNEDEQKVVDEWSKITSTDDYKRRSYADVMTDGTSTYWQEKHFFQSRGWMEIRRKHYSPLNGVHARTD